MTTTENHKFGGDHSLARSSSGEAVFDWFITCPKGLEGLLLEEVRSLGADNARETVAGVRASGPQQFGYHLCLWSRLANRVLLPLHTETVADGDSLYEAALRVPWGEHFCAESSISVDFIGSSKGIRNTQYGAQRVKDAVVDQFRAATGERPVVDRIAADIRINAHLTKASITLSLDFSGDSLHRRGYRLRQVGAPLKENLAAALLLRAGWPDIAGQGGEFVDLMCGGGTLVIEALMMAADVAPGLLRQKFGFQTWKGHKPELWQSLLEEAEARRAVGLEGELPACRGYDADTWAIGACVENARAAGFEGLLTRGSLGFEARSVVNTRQPESGGDKQGLILANPPYGERLGDKEQLAITYRQLGLAIKENYPGWRAAVMTSNPELGFELGLKARKKYRLYNGTLPSELLVFEVHSAEQAAGVREKQAQRKTEKASASDAAIAMLVNRLNKNRRRLKSWINKNNIQCYRLYDADLPEYAVAIDCYRNAVHVQEYAAPKSIDPGTAQRRLQDVEQALLIALGVEAERIFFKRRERQRANQQYRRVEKAGTREETFRGQLKVREGAANFAVNLDSYLDTGLFLDSRPVRKKIAELAAGKRFLNLFCYTATATVQAALGTTGAGETGRQGGAESSLSIDMSNTYLAWAERNFRLNGLDTEQHQLLRADCVHWLERAEALYRGRFDVILLDPPTFSNSKKMEKSLDIQRDHAVLIQQAAVLLAPGGSLVFANNFRRFEMDRAILSKYRVEEITTQTLDPDFIRNPRIHNCWLIRHQSER